MLCIFHQYLTLNNLIALSAIVIISIVFILLLIRLTTSPYPRIIIHKDERYYLDPISGERHPLPQLGTIFLSKKHSLTYHDIQPSTLYLSVIVPAYNEQDRLPTMLEEAIDYLERQSFKYEIIIVDDGSRDKTTQIALGYVQKYGTEKIRVITLVTNRGKGGAIRIGILASRGEYCLFADADGATKFSEFEKLNQFIQDRRKSYSKTELISKEKNFGNEFDAQMFPIAIGSRAHLEKESIAQRSYFRTILMLGFHFIVWLLTVKTVRDTQCGFKMFPRTIAQILFTHTHIERWAFDVELLLIAERLQLPIGEIPVEWTEIEGSKIVPVFSWIQMSIDVSLIFCNYTTGTYRLPKPPYEKIFGIMMQQPTLS
ncbi:dolichyl-phosphate beta-glucosyltransferase-like protein [Euroglyphus maynei]|uniref:dolichyl-phosphate beta-glucosyltransferase n=1 Tax=Euroglyphus maynei TaxID=6958 RepID=A0A1Y3AMJ3_EURMA|nr:dolichyl-phosphate beta-glucosyltransferase-like protein [Euroglyphus maynei]